MKHSLSAPTFTPTADRWEPYGKRGMLLGANVGNALEALWTSKLRSFLTMLSIIIGVAAVIVVVVLAQGATAQVNSYLTSLQATVMDVIPGSANVGGSTLSASHPTLTTADAQAIAQLPHVVNVSPLVGTGGSVIFGNQNWGTLMMGVSSSYATIGDWSLREGTWWNASQEAQKLPVVVLGQTVVNNTFVPAGVDPIGQVVRINIQLYRVIGVLSVKGSQGSQDQDDIMYVPYTTLLRGASSSLSIGDIQVQVDNIAVETQVQQAISDRLRLHHRLAPGVPDDFNVYTPVDNIQAQQQQNVLLVSLLLSIASVSLIVGGINIMNILLVSVKERTREIGLRVALGAQPSDVRNQFLIEALTLCLVGGVIGLVVGLVVGWLFAQAAQFPFIVSPLSFVVAIGVSMVVGLVFGLYPAIQASHLDPIVALRTE